MVILANASIDENGQISGGIPGDQTGREVLTREWYANGWTQLCRPKTAELANKIASAMEAACANDHIGYSQSKRLTLNAEAKKVGYNLSRIETNCDCDCSSLVAVACICAGLNVSPSMYTGNEVACLKGTGQFDVLTGSEYLADDGLLKRGDILVKQYHHTAVVTSTPTTVNYRYVDTDELNLRANPDMTAVVNAVLPFGAQVELLEHVGSWAKVTVTGYVASVYLSSTKPKTTYVTTDTLNMRETPGIAGKYITTIPKGATVTALGNTEVVDGGFLWREVTYSGKTGWVNGDYLA